MRAVPFLNPGKSALPATAIRADAAREHFRAGLVSEYVSKTFSISSLSRITIISQHWVFDHEGAHCAASRIEFISSSVT